MISRPQRPKPAAQLPVAQLPDSDLTPEQALTESADSDLQDVVNEVSRVEGLNDWTQVPDLFNTTPVPRFLYFGREEWSGERNYESHVACLRMPIDRHHVTYKIEINPSSKPIHLVLSRDMRFEDFDVEVKVNSGAALEKVEISSDPEKVHIVGASNIETTRNFEFMERKFGKF